MGALAPLIIGLCILPFFARAYVVEVAMLFFIYIMLASSYRLIVTVHDWQLYHIVLYGVGAYTSGLLAKNFGIPIWVTIPIGGAMASLVGMAIVRPLLRTKGWGFYIATFGLAELIRTIWLRFRIPFGGSTGIINIPYGPVVAGIGDSFKAIYADPLLAGTVGIRVPRYRLLACAIGGFIAGIAGGLLVHRLGAVDPRLFDIIAMIYLLVWVVVGGYRTFWGSIIGVCVMQAAFEFSRPLMQIRPLFFGLTLALVLVFMPGGIESLIPRAVARWRRLRGVPTAETG